MQQNSQPLDLEEALTQLKVQITPLSSTELIALHDARNRIVAQAITAPVNMPPFAASAMDGYAVRLQDWQADPLAPFQLIGESLAGHPFSGSIGTRQSVRVFTGAALPQNADQVLLQEEVSDSTATRVTFNAHAVAESYVRPVGHDMQLGQTLVAAGTRVTPLTQGLLAAAGVAQLNVFTKPRVGVFSSGDELVDAGTPPAALAPGQIYDSNRLTVLSLLANQAVQLIDLGRLADNPATVQHALAEAAQQCDMLITSGGVSVGDADYIAATIAQMGELSFWRLNLKPGKPLAYGRIGGCHIFGLPGNPVSTIVTLLLLARPALQHLCGASTSLPLRVSAITQDDLQHSPGRAEYQRGELNLQSATLQVSATGDQSSNRMTTFSQADCLVEIPKEAGNLPAGSQVRVLPFYGLL